MDTHEFLRAVWPADGLFVLASPFRPGGASKSVYAHRVFASVEKAADEAVRLSGQVDVYFAVHTVLERQVWNPLKKNAKDGSLGAFEVRSHGNMAAARAFFFDLDVEPGNPRKYDTAAEAAEALKTFCAATGLPAPLVVSSGMGLHVYWLVDQAIPSTTWRMIAERLRALAAKHGLRVDPARTTDVSSVLRVPGTLHLKDRANPRPVRVMRVMQAMAAGEFVQRLKDACIRLGVALATAVRRPLHDNDPMPDLGGNTTKIHDDRPPPTMQAVLAACAVMKHVHANQQTMSEPEWFQALNIVKYVDEPDRWAHAISEGYPGYTTDETTDKFERIRATTTGPTSCGVLAATCGEGLCAGCRFSGRVKNPIMAARLMDEAPAPSAPPLAPAQDDDEPPVQIALPNPPKPFRRLRSGGIVMDAASKDGDDITITIYDHDLYPLRRVVNPLDQTEQQFWRAELPREGTRDFILDADALYDARKLMVTLANNGVYPTPNNVPNLRDYMIAYISELQKAADAELQSSHLGWSDDHEQFTLPTGALQADGSVKAVSLSKQAERVSVNLSRAGTLDEQIAAMRFYDHSDYIPHQFYILCALAAPLFRMTGHHGVICHAQGLPGASKSTSLYAAASLWGHPKLYPINGTNSGATMRGRNERVSTLANLPVCVDEITNMAPRDAVDLAMNVTQPGHRIRLDVTGTERAAHGGYKSTIMLTNANASLHGMLSTENAGGTAGSMRVFEVIFRAQKVHQKWEADAFLLALERNHGHIGEAFMRFVVPNYARVETRVREAMRMVDEAASIAPAERFWSALIACVVVAASISKHLGLTSWSANDLLQWALTSQIPAMRFFVQEEYVDPVNCLTNYLAEVHGATIIVDTSRRDEKQNLGPQRGRPQVSVLQDPRGSSLMVQYDIAARTIWMAHKGFKDYCRRTSVDWREVVDMLRRDDASGLSIIVGRARKVLGADTPHGKAAVDAHIINADHPALAASLVSQWEEKAQEARRAEAAAAANVVPLRKGAGG